MTDEEITYTIESVTDEEMQTVIAVLFSYVSANGPLISDKAVTELSTFSLKMIAGKEASGFKFDDEFYKLKAELENEVGV
jgi:hypothetical protein